MLMNGWPCKGDVLVNRYAIHPFMVCTQFHFFFLYTLCYTRHLSQEIYKRIRNLRWRVSQSERKKKYESIYENEATKFLSFYFFYLRWPHSQKMDSCAARQGHTQWTSNDFLLFFFSLRWSTVCQALRRVAHRS